MRAIPVQHWGIFRVLNRNRDFRRSSTRPWKGSPAANGRFSKLAKKF